VRAAGDIGTRQLTRMFPAPLTSFAPTYMASDGCGPGTNRSVFSGRLRVRFGDDHVGNI
jgi:hypothetical protein